MKAVFFHHHGGPEVLEYSDFPTPQPGPGEVLVALKAAALNRLDLFVRNGWPGIQLEVPHIPGADGAGEVAALGPEVTRFAVGDRAVINGNLFDATCEFCQAGQDNRCLNWGLLGETRRGTYADYIALPERNLLKMPEGFGYAEAAAASLVYSTAWHSLIVRGELRPGETVVVVGAGGGVNIACLQIAKYAGAIVVVVAADEEKARRARVLGADVTIDRSKEDWSKAVYQLTGKRGAEVIVDNVGAATMQMSQRAARKGGRILTVGNTGGPKFEFDNRYMFAKHLSLIGSTMGTRRDFERVMGLVFAGKLRPVVDSVFPLSEARAAQERMEQNAHFGKIVLTI